MRTPVIQLVALGTVEAALLASLPILLIATGCRIINGLRDAWLPWTPYVELAAFAAGLAAGVMVFGYNVDPAILGPSAVFRVGGPWDMSFGEFIGQVANPLRYAVFPPLLSTSGVVVLLLAVGVVVAPVVRFGSSAAAANVIRNAFLTLSGAYSAVYGLGYCLWLLNRLNFWVFLLLMIVIQLRSRSERIVLNLK